jgi:hypothetical protein
MIIDKFTIQTPDSIAIARDKLNRQIDDKSSLHKSYMTGQVSGNTFKLYCISRRTIPLTTIYGYFETVQSGTVVHLELEVKSIIIIGFSLFILFLSVDTWQKAINIPSTGTYVWIVMIVIFSVNFVHSFQSEKIFYRKKLPQIFL